MTRKALKWYRWSTLVVELAGFAISLYLVLISLKIIYPGEVPCPRTRLFHCTSVLRGEWSKMGPIPVSILGALYFLGQAFLTVAGEKHRQWILRAKVVGATGAFLYIAWLRAVEIVWLKGLCPWCWAVAVCTLLEVYLLYPLASPPLPRTGWGRRLAYLLGGFVVAVAATTLLGFWVYEQSQRAARQELAQEAKRPAPRAAAPPATTPAVKAPAATPRPTPRPKVIPPENTGSVEEGVPVTNEVKLLVRHGWTVVAATESLTKYIREEAPVLVLVFDPWCEECQALIRSGLENDEIRKQPVKLVAIEQTSLVGKLSNEVTHVPTLLLVDRAGNVLFKHEGRMETRELIDAISTHLRPQAPEH